MTAPAELKVNKESSFNQGEVVEINGWPRWCTQVGEHSLTLDIVPTADKELWIASFVVMEQNQHFLEEMGRTLASEMLKQTDKKILLITTESKGSHFVPYVWQNLAQIAGTDRLVPNIITLRKGKPKVYMDRAVRVHDQFIGPFSVPYYSVTSREEQTMTMSPRDIELLFSLSGDEVEAVYVDDFLGRGGSALGAIGYIGQLNKQLTKNLEDAGYTSGQIEGLYLVEPPKIICVIGADGNLYQAPFQASGRELKVIPEPLPLRLPTFSRKPFLNP